MSDTPGCDGCEFCCKVLEVTEIEKPQGKWCQHIVHGRGCGIYPERPFSCSAFKCLWLLSQSRANPAERFAPELRPDRSRVMFTAPNDGKILVAHVDAGFPGAWRSGPAGDFIATVNKAMDVIVVQGDKRALIKKGEANK